MIFVANIPRYCMFLYKDNKIYYLKSKILYEKQKFHTSSPTCPSIIIKIINFLIKKVEFTKKFFSVYYIRKEIAGYYYFD